MSKAKMKLNGVATLVVDSDNHSITLLQQMMRGLGMDPPTVVHGAAEARQVLENRVFDLCLIEARLPDGSGVELVQELRRRPPPLKLVPILVLTGYSHLRTVTRVRDAGAHMVVKKPLSPQVLYDHIAWAANPNRPFIEASVYAGPDRRFKFTGPPDGSGRRDTDLSAELGEATQPNMSQAEIDALMKPTRIVAT